MLDTAFSTIDEVLADLRQGKMIVLTDDEDRENEGDIVMAAEFVTPEAINFMVREAAGYLFVSLTEADCDRLNLHPQTETNTSVRGTPLMVSIDGHPKHGFTTGVSAAERAKTIKMTLDPSTVPSDFVRPGHINPLRARDGGVLVRIGQTEGSVDLCKLAGLTPAAVGIEICNPDGTMARLPDLTEFIKKHGMKMCSVKQIIEHRLKRAGIVDRLDPKPGTKIETPEGEFNLVAFQSVVDPLPHIALTVGDVGALDSSGQVIESDEPTLVRVHRRDLLGDIFLASDEGQTDSTGDILRASMRTIQKEGRGALIYLRPHGLGDGLSQRLTRPAGHSVEDAPQQSVSAPMLEYGVGCQLVRALGISKIRLLSNSSTEYPQIEAFGLEIVERMPLSLE